MEEKYIGELSEGEPQRFGMMIHSNGDKYFGEWKEILLKVQV